MKFELSIENKRRLLMTSIKKILKEFENQEPEIVFEWNDSETDAKGWVVINSLRGGAAGGGTRMRKGLTLNEVRSLAKTMEVKFTVSGPVIGGAKSGIDFDPTDSRKKEVLSRWYKVVSPLLKQYYGTGGDMNVDEGKEVVPLTEKYGLWHPQEGIVNGFYNPNDADKIKKIGQLRLGVPSVIANPAYTPDYNLRYSISDMITGYGVAQSIIHYYKIWGGDIRNKTALIQGWGNVGAAAGFFLVKEGVKIKGIIDKWKVLIVDDGLEELQVTNLFNNRENKRLTSESAVDFEEGEEAFWSTPADIFIPCAGSRLVTKSNVLELMNNGCSLIAAGANVPFDNKAILYGDLHEWIDQQITVIPDFIANCGMARTFAYLMQSKVEISSKAIFEDVSQTIFNALEAIYAISTKSTHVSERALGIAIKKLI
ncbi:MAG: glutamate dehydrogenase/leucine dehydrogenase [Flavobacteriales bacterium]|jgi:glutamate dehydrogenase/leucine dehydrogenase|tara:strand:- start:4333 stop:5610 length:1278 start_codon:yes stop_codon:yes gene_type:complete